MKRSDMVQKIYDVLNCDGVLEHSLPIKEPVKFTERHLLWISDEILKEVEKAGMLPPYIIGEEPFGYISAPVWEKE